MVVELEVISQYPLPEINNGCTTSRIPMRVFQNKMFVIEALQIEEHVNSKGLVKAKFATGKYDGEFYKFNTPYKTLRDLYFTPIVIKGLGEIMHKQIFAQPYDALVSVGVGSIESQLRTLKRKYGIIEHADDTWLGLCNHQYSEKLQRNIFYIIISSSNTDKKKYWNTISHEISHLIQEILEHKSIFFHRGKANEPYAYLNGYLMGELFEFFEKEYNKINK